MRKLEDLAVARREKAMKGYGKKQFHREGYIGHISGTACAVCGEPLGARNKSGRCRDHWSPPRAA